MKAVFFTLLFLSSTTFAQTFSEKRAGEMVYVLQSEVLKALLKQEDAVGNITGISFYPSVSMDVASRYKVTFSSGFGGGKNSCSAVVAKIDGVNRSITLEESACD